MAAKKFPALYKRLNSEQRRAVDTIEGPVMVVAGPGTGKTQILTLRIANILQKTDVPPDAILALTFTESAAATCRRRLIDILGTEGYRVHIHTFHSYANDVIQRFPDSFPRIVGSRPISSVERIALLQELIRKEKSDTLRPFGNIYFYIPFISQKLSELKREDVSPEHFSQQITERKKRFHKIPDLYSDTRKKQVRGKYAQYATRLQRDEALLGIYRFYEEALGKRHAYDYEDMLLEVVRRLREDPNLLLTLQEECQYILADEHQDANESQSHLLELLASFHEHPNIFVVGDEKQAIFSFQGAQLNNFFQFKKTYPDAALIVLKKNYRSTQPILDAAHALISQMPIPDGRAHEPLIAAEDHSPQKVEVISLPRPIDECDFIAKDIRTLIKQGVRPSDIAVLYRVNRDAQLMHEALSALNIPTVIEAQQDALQDIYIQKFIAILQSIAGYGSDALLVPVLHIDFIAIPPLLSAQFLAHIKTNVYAALSNKKILKQAGIARPGPLLKLGKSLERWKRLAHNTDLLTVLDTVARESGLIGSLIRAPFPEERIALLEALFQEARILMETQKHPTLESFLTYLALLEEYHLSLSAPYSSAERQGVRLMTVHRAKGQEFDLVYILHANNGHWGNRRERAYFSPLKDALQGDTEDERRLFYVALTRAKSKVTVTYARENENGSPLLPSQFIEEMGEVHLERKEESAKGARLTSAPKHTVREYLDGPFVKNLFALQGLSVTAINNYLECPWRYFYRNLLRIPEAPQKELEYGTAIHLTLRDFFEQWKEGKQPTKSFLLTRFKATLKLSPLYFTHHAELMPKGLRALSAYYDQWHKTWNRDIINELALTVSLPVDISGLLRLRLRGDIDKLSFEKDRVVIHDYKTGRRKTRGQIIGKEEAQEWGTYKRQLVFYNLLLEASSYGRKARSHAEGIDGVVEFIEPDNRGICQRELLELTEKESMELERLIRKIAQEIWSLRFAQKGCKRTDCRYCALREFAAPALTDRLSR